MRSARDAFLKIRALFETPEWLQYFKDKGIRARDTRVANSIINYFRQGMGLSKKRDDIDLHLPLPWNVFDMSVLCVTEFAHNRILGILGTITRVMEDLIPHSHKKDWFHNHAKFSEADIFHEVVIFRYGILKCMVL